MLLHANAVAQNRAARVRTAGIHRNHADGLPFRANQARKLIAQSALTRPGGPGDAENQRAAGMRKKLAQQRLGFGTAILDPRRGASQRAQVAVDDFLRGVSHGLMYKISS